MKKIHILFFVLAIFVLPISIDTVYGAQECDEVKVRIKGKDTQDALKRVTTQLRLHGKALEKNGNEYEGQMDIACLIGLYMTTGLESDVDALDRYIALEEMMRNQFGQNDQVMMEAVWKYKDMSFVTDSMRREYYAESEFFLLALANMSKEIVTANQVEGFPYSMIQDYAFCRGAIREREKLDLHRRAVEEISATEKDWSVLSERQFKQNKKTWIEKPELIEVCDQNRIITSRTVKDVKDTYRKKANDLTRTYWEEFLKGGTTPERGWKSLDWLAPSCGKPSKNEKRIINSAKEMAKALDSSKWWQQDQRKVYLESSNLAKKVQAVGEPSCQKSIGARLAGFGNAIDNAREDFRNAVRNDVERYWDGLTKDSEDQNLKERLTNSLSFVAEITRQPEICVVPNEDFKALIRSYRDIRRSETLSETANALKKISSRDQQRLSAFSEECDGQPAAFAKVIVERIENYRAELKREYRAEILKVWIKFYKTGKYDPSWSGLAEIVDCDDCIPMPEDQEVIVSLRKGRDIDREIIQRFYNRLEYWSKVAAPDSFLEIRNNANRYIKKWDKDVARYWNDFLKHCQIPAADQSQIYTSTNEICSVPTGDELKVLLRYCRLEKLSRYNSGIGLNTIQTKLSKDRIEGRPCEGNDYLGNKFEGIWAPQKIIEDPKEERSPDDGETISTETEPTEVEPTEVEPTEVEPTEVEPTEVEPTEVEPKTLPKVINSNVPLTCQKKSIVTSSAISDDPIRPNLLGIFRPDILSNEAKDEGFSSPGNYKKSFSALRIGRLEDIYDSRVRQCTSDVKGISILDIELLRANYLGLFSQLVTDLKQSEDDREIELSYLIEDIIEQYLKGRASVVTDGEKEAQPSAAPDEQMFSFWVDSYPQGAKIIIDNEDKGVTPENLLIAGGIHTVRFEKRGYQPWEKTITIMKNDYLSPELTKIDLDLIPTPEVQIGNGACKVLTIMAFNAIQNLPILDSLGADDSGTDYADFCMNSNCTLRQRVNVGGVLVGFKVLSIDTKEREVILLHVSVADRVKIIEGGAFDLTGHLRFSQCKVMN